MRNAKESNLQLESLNPTQIQHSNHGLVGQDWPFEFAHLAGREAGFQQLRQESVEVGRMYCAWIILATKRN